MTNIVYTTCPVIRRERSSFLYRVWPSSSLAGPILVPFEEEVLWVRESEARILFRHGGRVLKEGSTYNDWYGYLSSVDASIEAARVVADHYGVTRDSTLEIAVEVVIRDIPLLEDKSPDAAAWNGSAMRKRYVAVPDDSWFRNTAWEDVPTAKLQDNLEEIASKTVATMEAWSSSNDDSRNEALLAEVRRVRP